MDLLQNGLNDYLFNLIEIRDDILLEMESYAYVRSIPIVEPLVGRFLM